MNLKTKLRVGSLGLRGFAESGGRCWFILAVVAATLTTALVQPAWAQTPMGCTANNVQLTISRPFPSVCVGDTIEYTVTITNQGAGACNMTNVTVRFWSPADPPNMGAGNVCGSTNESCILDTGIALNAGSSISYSFPATSACSDLDFVTTMPGTVTAFACIEGTSQTIPGGEEFTAANQISTLVNGNPTAAAGPDDSKCAAASGPTTFNLAGSGTNGTPSWQVTGQPAGCTVTLMNANTFTPTASFPAGCTGCATLTLTVTSNAEPPCPPATDTVVLCVNANPTAAAGPDDSKCAAASGPTTFNLAGSGTNGTPSWQVTTQPAGCTVTLMNANTLTPTASFPAGCTGCATLTLTVTSTATPPCPPAMDTVELCVDPNPTCTIQVTDCPFPRTLTVIPSGGTAIQWGTGTCGACTPLAGETGLSLIVNAAGNYCVSVTNTATTCSGCCDVVVEECGGEGCTPGYWKQSQHFGNWTDPFDPLDLFSATCIDGADAGMVATCFENAFPDMTLLDVLKQGGGGLKALGRHTVAALLNAAHPNVDYGVGDPEDVIKMFNAVHPNGDIEGLHNDFADFNEAGCPLGRAEGNDAAGVITEGTAPAQQETSGDQTGNNGGGLCGLFGGGAAFALPMIAVGWLMMKGRRARRPAKRR